MLNGQAFSINSGLDGIDVVLTELQAGSCLLGRVRPVSPLARAIDSEADRAYPTGSELTPWLGSGVQHGARLISSSSSRRRYGRDGCAEGTVRSGLDASAEGAAVCDGTRDTVFLTTEGGRWPLRFVCTQAWRGRDCKQRCQSRSVDSRASLLVGAGNRGLFLQLDRILRRLFPVSGQAPERQGTPLLCPASPDE